MANTIGNPAPGPVIALCGPDGTGKTTIADVLAEELPGPALHVHHRPGLLPYPAGDPHRDYTNPYQHRPRTPVQSMLKLVYLYLDWLLGWFLLIRPHSRRGGSVIIQRPWDDMVVDPARYRLDVPEWVVRHMGRFLPRPDLTVLLNGSPHLIHERKPELSEAEIGNQIAAWRAVIGNGDRTLVVGVDGDLETTMGPIRRASGVGLLRDQLDLGSVQSGRFLLPRTPASAAATGIWIYQPLDHRARIIHRMAWLTAQSGLFRLLPAGRLPDELLLRVASWIPRGGTVAARRLRGGRRWVVQVIEADGSKGPILKVALSASDRISLDREHQALHTASESLEPPLAAPSVSEHRDGVLVMEPVDWKLRDHPLSLPAELARGLGELFTGTSVGSHDEKRGRVHGDLAPWNLLWDGELWFLLDWEESRPDGLPYHDLFHHWVQSHALMGSPSLEEIIDGIDGRGGLGEALQAFAHAADVPDDEMPTRFLRYLQMSMDEMDPTSSRFGPAVSRRRELERVVEALVIPAER